MPTPLSKLARLSRRLGKRLVLQPENEIIALAWFATLLVIAIFFTVWRPALDPDLFWHVRSGSDILNMGIPRTDWYSFTFANFPWVHHEYAQDVLMSLIAKVDGLRLVSIFYALVVLFAYTLALRWALPRKPRLPWPWVLIAGLLIAVFSQPFLGARPQMFTYVFLLLTVGIVQRFRENRRTRWIWALPLLFAIWGNWHGSFIAGLIVLGLAVGVATLEAIMWPARVRKSAVRTLLAITAASVLAGLATLANPYGTGVWIEALRTIGDRDLHKNIVEWFVPDINSSNGIVFFAVSAVLMVTLALKKVRVELFWLGLVLIFWVAGLTAVRNMPIFYLFAVPLIITSVWEFTPHVLPRILRAWPALVAITIAVSIGIAATVPFAQLWTVDRDQKVFEAGKFPVGAAQFLAEHDEYSNSHIFNEYAWGGYLLYRVPWFKPFIDGRMPSWELDGVRIINEYFAIDRTEDGWEQKMAQYEIDVVVVRPDHRLVGKLKLDNRFEEVFRDDFAVIFAKKSLALSF